MLTQLYIKNFALIEELSIAFAPGLTIITGETGAGKSILIGALGQVLGARASADFVRSGSKKAVIEATLVPERPEVILPLLAEAGIDPAEELILRREIPVNGQSRCFINDSPCTLQVLKQAGDLLIDLHGQHEHQMLLHPEMHVSLLDDYAGLAPLLTSYREVRAELNATRKKLSRLRADADRIRDKRSMLEYRLEELTSLDLREGEAGEIENEIVLLENAETLHTLSSGLSKLLYDDETSAFVQLSEAVHRFDRLAEIDGTFSVLLEEIRNAAGIVEELSRSVRGYSENIEFNPERLEELRERQHLLQRTAKKHGRSVEGLVELRNDIADELAAEENLPERTEELEQLSATLRQQLSELAESLSSDRKHAAAELEESVVSELAVLGIPDCIFRVLLTKEASLEGDILLDGACFNAFDNGCDRVEFLISTNPGEEPRPLAKIASGGEISRVMLAMKSVLARSARLPILIFDEIDTGISGAIASAVGKSLKRLSATHQILSITHLPQIAAMADRHLCVEKAVRGDRTTSSVRQLDEGEHIEAVASLFSGRERSESSLQVAAELVEQAKAL
ncbi:DNA repair protein RecN [Prosthecochloris sp. GSB1]|uniref:DNA repair protein RecN n=1 Tax=Prosthecochloris sp. GSB1 TaxID=281093 RepID=UPI000B8CB04D|nr:DNA repair protein RecN [Prosthecochloris sp. GSB1]ASQ91041.1 DNA repair protein RecN [Prosthecochloris sp. GSB1]